MTGRCRAALPRAASAAARLCAAAGFAGLIGSIGWTNLGTATAAEPSAPSTRAQPRVAYAMHSARINQIRASADFSRIVSVSQDKTARVWRTEDLQLLRTLHVPSEPGEEGALRAVALTPDGRHAIVGGWTGIAWRGQGQLYRFELATGRLVQTWRGLPSIIEALAISPDGRQIAVGLGGTAGLRVLDLADGREIVADKDYAGHVSFADYASDGTLATTSADGCLRLYAPDGRIVFRAAWPPPAAGAPACPGSALGGVRFSPDGRRLAFGHQERPELVVMEVATRRVERVVKPDDPRQRSLCCPNWAAAGDALFMHGTYDHAVAGDPTPLHRFDLASGRLERQAVGRQRFTNVLPLPGGDVLFSTTAPSLVRLDAGGRVRAEALPPNGDFRFPWPRFAVSADGQQLQLPMKADGSAVHRFDLTASPDQAFGALADAGNPAAAAAASPSQPPVNPPLRNKPGAPALQAALDDLGYLQPVTLGPHAVRLKPFQSVRSWARAPADDGVAVGTQWSVLELDGLGRVRWEHDLPAPAFQVTVTANGRWVVAAVGDGTVRWFDREGRERLGAFLHADGREWVAWRHDGFYTSSPGGDAYIGWLLNRGDDEAPDFFRAVQFERRLYRPDLVAGTLTEATRRSAAADDLVRTLQALAPPRVTIERLEAAPVPGQLSLRVAVQPRGRPVRELGVYVDGVPLLRSRERAVAAPGTAGATTPLVREFTVPAADASLSVRVEAETDESIGSDETAPLRRPSPATPARGRLWVVAVGVHRFDHLPDLTPLPFATNDARELAAALRAEQGRAFTEVRSVLLTEAEARKPTKAAILAALGALQEVGPDDTTVVFLASHGTTDAAEYYFVTKDTTLADATRVQDAQAARTALPAGSVPSLVTGSELTAVLRRLPGRRIVILDTCESSAADGRANPHTLLKRSASAQLAVMSAATGSEFSYDSMEAPHGVFTFALLSVLRQAREPQTLQRLFDDARPRVEAGLQRIRDAERNPAERAKIRQTPMLNALPALQRTVLAQPNS